MWKQVEGTWRWPYRVSDQGVVQKFCDGKWKTIKPYPYNGIMRVQMWPDEKTINRMSVSKLVADAFMGGTPPGMIRTHKNGMKMDNAVENIRFITRSDFRRGKRSESRKPVLKVDRQGNVVEIYSSQTEAAKKNHMSQQAISRRCNGLIADPYRLDDHNYIFEEKQRRPKDAKA